VTLFNLSVSIRCWSCCSSFMSKPQLLSNDTDTFVDVRVRSVGISTSFAFTSTSR